MSATARLRLPVLAIVLAAGVPSGLASKESMLRR